MAAAEEPEAEVLGRGEVEGMKVEAVTGRACALVGVKNSVRMVVRMTTPEPDQAERAPLHVACVMDCSGSMGGEKIAYAKKAVLKLVKHLQPFDVLHFVTYDNDARVIFENGDLSEAGKHSLRQQIQSVGVGGQTNLCAGLELAVSLLGCGEAASAKAPEDGNAKAEPRAEADSKEPSKPPAKGAASSTSVANSREQSGQDDHVIRRIFLFSDGRVNCGTRDTTEIKSKVASWAAQGITTGSFGIGNDFDEPLMRGLAASGQGRYQFLATAQDIPKLVSKAIHDLIDVFAADATLEIRGCAHTVVTRVHGGHDEDEEGIGSADVAGLVHLGDVHSDNIRVILAELEVLPPGNADIGQVFDAAEWILTCNRNGAPVQLSGRVRMRPTRDRTAIEDVTPAVQLPFAIREATDLERAVANHLSRHERQKARTVKATQLALLREALGNAQQEQDRLLQSGSNYDLSKDLELLQMVFKRARAVETQLEDEDVDEERMARQCRQYGDDFQRGSLCNLQSPVNSPCQSPGGTPPGSPMVSPRAGSPPPSPPAPSPPGGYSTWSSLI